MRQKTSRVKAAFLSLALTIPQTVIAVSEDEAALNAGGIHGKLVLADGAPL